MESRWELTLTVCAESGWKAPVKLMASETPALPGWPLQQKTPLSSAQSWIKRGSRAALYSLKYVPRTFVLPKASVFFVIERLV